MRYEEERAVVALDVDEFCERTSGFGSLGSRTSRKYESVRQKYRDSLAEKHGIYFMPDYRLVFTVALSGIHYELEGMADGILKKDGNLMVYSLKTVRGKQFAMPPDPVFSAKGLCLAHFAATEFEFQNVILRTVLINADTGKARITEREYTYSMLARDFTSRLIKLERFAKLCISDAEHGRDSIAKMHFPFGKMREGQRELIEECYRAIYNGSRLFAQAPTGIGKTISVLYPSVKALGTGLCDRIFYLTAKASTRREAFSAVKKMFEAGAKLKVMILNPKEQMCRNSQAKMSGERIGSFCSPDRCEMSRGYYSRREDALYELLTMANGYTPRLITDVAVKHNVCPYELSLDLSEYCDIIICDYNYIFDPAVKLRRYFGELSEKKSDNNVFLIDEAHNLADRAREMYSADLSLSDFERYYSELPIDENKLSSYFEEIMRVFKGLKRLCEDNLFKDSDGNEQGFYFSTEPIGMFSEAACKFLSSLELYSKSHPNAPVLELLYDLTSKIRSYESILDYYDEHFRTYLLVSGGDITVKLYCIDPSGVLNECMNNACACVLFSATLTPIDYFSDVLGGADRSVTLSLPSPFPRKNLCLCTLPISTRHADREGSTVRIAKAVAAAILPKKGNYIVYFPSYSYMDSVAKYFAMKFPAVLLNVQKRGMTHAEKERFLDFFSDKGDEMRVGFCVLGGSFSEGVDLPGSRLIGSIIVGVGLPQLSNELNIIRDFYELKYERGYDYAYTFPGMNKVLQACGRVIRRESDRGIVVLIDDRYQTPQYKSLFPEHWENIKNASSAAELAKIIGDFWENTNKL